MSSALPHLAASSSGENVHTGHTAMSTIHEITKFDPATTNRQVYSPLEAYWKAFQAWRSRRKLQTELCRLTDSELMDIGITRSEIDYVASNRSISPDPLLDV
jgi:uncharacterized protein YjiS (DUF1127 family)